MPCKFLCVERCCCGCRNCGLQWFSLWVPQLCIQCSVSWAARSVSLCLPWNNQQPLGFLAILMITTEVIWSNILFRGTLWVQKTPVMFSGSWWRSARSAASPGRCATRRGWTTSCSYLSPWRQQQTKVKDQTALFDLGMCHIVPRDPHQHWISFVLDSETVCGNFFIIKKEQNILMNIF